MNYTTTLVLVACLLAQFASCSEVGYKVVCKTDYSYVLRQFNRTATLFQENLHEVERCLNNSNEDLASCFYAANILTPYSDFFFQDPNCPDCSYHPPFSIKDVNDMHQRACNVLNNHAEKHSFVKDIPLNEYNVVTGSENVRALLDSLKIGIKVKTDKSEVIKMVRKSTELMATHYQDIKSCITVNGNDFDQNSFFDCIHAIDNSLVEDLDPVIYEFRLLGEPMGIDDIAMKIMLNQCLNLKVSRTNNDLSIKPNLIKREYDWNLGDGQIDELINECTKWYWIRVCAGVLAVAVIVGLVSYFFKKKSTAVEGDEEKVNSDAQD